MGDNVPSMGQRIEQVRSRLYETLGASSHAESEVIRYLSRALPIEAVESLADMAERAARNATAEGYDRGWQEAGGRP
jgi:hypothetical protein